MSQRTAVAAIVGPGHVGAEVLAALHRGGTRVDLRYVVGRGEASPAMEQAGALGVATSGEGVDWLLRQYPLPDVVFEATTAAAARAHAPRFAQAGVSVVDLTPSSIGSYACPLAGVDGVDGEVAGDPGAAGGPRHVNAVTAGGQAAIPIVRAVSSVVDVPYAEVVTSIASVTAGRGMRADIDDLTTTTARALEQVGGAGRAKAITVLSPAQPPVAMRSTVFCAIPADAGERGALQDAVTTSIFDVAERVRAQVPGYRVRAQPQFDPARRTWQGQARVMVLLEVTRRGGGHDGRRHAGNLEIMAVAAARLGDRLAEPTTGRGS